MSMLQKAAWKRDNIIILKCSPHLKAEGAHECVYYKIYSIYIKHYIFINDILHIFIMSWEFLPGGLDCRDPQESGWEILDSHWLPELSRPVYRAAREAV